MDRLSLNNKSITTVFAEQPVSTKTRWDCPVGSMQTIPHTTVSTHCDCPLTVHLVYTMTYGS